MILRQDGSNPLLTDLPVKVWNVFAGTLNHVANAQKGPGCVGPNRNHQLDSKIWQLSAHHPFRAPYFYRPSRFVIITHVFAKPGGKKSKAPQSEIDKANQLLAVYEAAEAGKTLVMEDIDD